MIILLAAASFLTSPFDGANAGRELGEASRANFAAMIVPPPPREPAVEGADGVMAVNNIRRLHTDRVKTLKNTAIEPRVVWERTPK